MPSLKSFKRLVKRIIKPEAFKPVLGNHPYGGPPDSPITLAKVCGPSFKINIPNANSTITLGFCGGFAQIGVRYQLVSVFDLVHVLPQLRKPFVFLSSYDYLEMTKVARRILRNYPHFVWGHPDLEVMQKIYSKYDFPYAGISKRVYRLVLDSEPNFVFAPVPPSALEFYSNWQRFGLRLTSIPLACDTTRYYPEPENHQYSGVKMAFVGGYWPKKAIQFEKYLRPYEDILTVFGYSHWPYKGYKGLLLNGEEKLLYQNARVSPALSEPHAEVIGDIVERVFKVMGSGGLAVTDVVPFYRELFEPDELLVPSNMNEYHGMVRQSLSDENSNQQYRKKGYQAIMERHTYVHRARTILNYLSMSI